MAEKKEGMMVILSSPSGAGKTTLVKKISQRKNFTLCLQSENEKSRKNFIVFNNFVSSI